MVMRLRGSTVSMRRMRSASAGRDGRGDGEEARHDARGGLLFGVAAKGQAASGPGKEHYTHGPDVHLAAIVGDARADLGRRVVQRAPGLVEELIGLRASGKAKVGQQNVAAARASEENVLALDVAVHEAVAVHVVHRVDQLTEEALYLRVCERLAVALLHELERVTASGERQSSEGVVGAVLEGHKTGRTFLCVGIAAIISASRLAVMHASASK